MKNHFFSQRLIQLWATFLLSLLLGSKSLLAQDNLIFVSGKTISCKVLEINQDKVLYKKWTDLEGFTFSVDIDALKSVVYENGKIELLSEKPDVKALAKDNEKHSFDAAHYQTKNVIKYEALSWMVRHFAFSYERALSQNVSLELTAGFFGIGPDLFDEAYDFYSEVPNRWRTAQSKTREKGFFLKLGPKIWFNDPTPMEGFYIQPEVFYTTMEVGGSYLSERFLTTGTIFWDANYSYKGSTAGGLLNLGVQKRLGKRWVIDLSTGIGVAKVWDFLDFTVTPGYRELGIATLPEKIQPEDGEINNEFRYGHVIRKGVALQAGFSIGRLF